MDERRGVIFMLLATFFFAGMNVCVKLVSHLPTHQVVTIRAIVTLLFTLPVLLYWQIPLWGNHKKLLVLRGVMGTIGLMAYFYTLQNMPLATAVALKELAPIFTIAIAARFLGEAAHPFQWFCFIAGFIGTLLCRGVGVKVSWWELAIGAFGSLAAACAYTCVRVLRNHDEAWVVVFYFPLITLPAIGPYSFTQWAPMGSYEWTVALAIGLLVTLAQYFMTKAYQLAPARRISHLSYLGTAYGVAVGWYGFGESIDLPTAIGILLILSGALIASTKLPVKKSS